MIGNSQQSGGRKKLFALITALVIVIVVLAVLDFYHPAPASASATSPSFSSQAKVWSPFNITIKTSTAFSKINVFFGDGTESTIDYNGSNIVKIEHIYESPGIAFVFYTVDFPDGYIYSSTDSLIKVTVLPSPSYINSRESLGVISYNTSLSSKPEVPGEAIFSPGSHVAIAAGYQNEPMNSSYMIVKQVVDIAYGQFKPITINYLWNSSASAYEEPVYYYNVTFNSPGLYPVILYTYTAKVNSTTGIVSGSYQVSSVFYDIAVFSRASIEQSSTVFVYLSAAVGGPTSLDPDVDYGVNGYQITLNTLQTLVTWNGSSSTTFVPQLASQLPSTTNGGINTNYKNYTVHAPWGISYTVHIKPYENYTFHIRSNATWQNGQPVTAWDVEYSIARSLLFVDGSPSTPGWIRAQYLLPGNYYTSNTFWNITQNITVNNATNNITFHFQEPLSPVLVFNIFAAIGGEILDPQWLQEHGAGIPWSPEGFKEYQTEGNAGSYDEYVEHNVFADGPYEIAYQVPSSTIVLIKNPYFSPPGPWYPAPKIGEIIIEYISSTSTRVLAMKSQHASAISIPTSYWSEVESLEKQGIAKVYPFNMLGIYYYAFNFNINSSILDIYYHGANVPEYLFTSLNARRAFAYAYPYQQYLDYDVGNAIYNITFGERYAGVLAKGMLGYQSIGELNNTTTGVPYFSLSIAARYWSHVNLSKYGITESSGKYLFDGKPLVIPIFVFAGDSVDLAGATLWGQYLSEIIQGASFPVIPVSDSEFSGFLVNGQNPMPIYLATWFPDYPYPSDYLYSLAYPSNGTFIPGSNSFIPQTFLTTGHMNQYRNVTLMETYYEEAFSATNLTIAINYYHKMNEMLVNMTELVYVQQVNGFWVVSPNLNSTAITRYQENVMFASGGDLLFNYLYFS
ncbi:ABC transporter substrate-binding protein [Thermoplasma volcanium]|nr:ABC transporter substrate-binding protein [Thermoplasma volcanium]